MSTMSADPSSKFVRLAFILLVFLWNYCPFSSDSDLLLTTFWVPPIEFSCFRSRSWPVLAKRRSCLFDVVVPNVFCVSGLCLNFLLR